MTAVASNLKKAGNRTIRIHSVIVAFLATIPATNMVITALIPSLAGSLMSPMYLFGALLFLINLILSKRSVKIGSSSLFIFCVVTVAYIITLFGDAKSALSPTMFGVYFILSMLVACTTVDATVFIKACVVFPTIGNFWADKIFSQTYGSITMGASYAFLLPVICTIVYFWAIKDKHWLITVAGILNIGYLLQLVLYGSRGPIICIAVCAALLIVVKHKDSGVYIASVKALLLMLVLILLVIFFSDILTGLISLLNKVDIRISALNKIQRLLLEQDLSNGRTVIMQATIAGIKDSPLLGHGLSTFDYYTSHLYPHNFFLQMIYDMGIFGMLILITPILKGLLRWIKTCDDGEYIYMIALMSASIPGALFSNDLWTNFPLWLTLASLISLNSNRKIAFNYNIKTTL